MKKQILVALLLTMSINGHASSVGEFAIANRGGGTLSFLDYTNEGELQVLGDYDGSVISEPMYVTPLKSVSKDLGEKKMLAFADRSLNKLFILDSKTKKEVSSVKISSGAFHQFSHPELGLKVAVATDIERGFDFIELDHEGKLLKNRSFSVPNEITTGNPHDIIFDHHHIYLTVKGIEDGKGGKFDTLLKVDQKGLQVVGKMNFSEDIHLFNPVKAPFFVVVEQDNGKLSLISKKTFTVIQEKTIAIGVHGVTGTEDGSFLFATDIDERAGSPAVIAIKSSITGLEIVATQSLLSSVAHNIAVDDRGEVFTIVVTHSGARSSKNSILSFGPKTKELVLINEVDTGINPFGLTFF